MSDGAYIVADFGKTHAKLTLWSKGGDCLAREIRANDVPQAAPYRPLDVAGIADWLIAMLGKFAAHPVEAIIPVSHGAAVAGVKPSPLQGRGLGEGTLNLGADGQPPPSIPPLKGREDLAFVPLDYEWEIPASIVADYRVTRDPFSVTGSPAFPVGLNLGAQLHYLETLGALEGATLLPYAQYWAWHLSGVAASEVTSLGCHSDVWNPAAGDFSPMAKARRWAAQFAPLAKAGDVIGTLRPELAARTGLSSHVKIYAGLHDSNAALVAARGFAEIADQEATVLSTGTWFVAMRSPKEPIDLTTLPETRDCLVNVDVNGRPVPSARFMGGREIDLLGERIDQGGLDGLPEALATGAMILPSFAPGAGPFPHARGRWINEPDDSAARRAAIALYAALMADTSLSLIGARERVLVEGRFALSEIFVSALASLRPRTQVLTAFAAADVSFGALRLVDPSIKPTGELARVAPLPLDLTAYSREWHHRIEKGSPA